MQAVRRPVRALVQRSLRQSTRALTTRSPLQPAMQSMIKRTTLFKQSPFALQTGALRSMFIQTESTPNPQSLKFLPGRVLAMRAERRGPPPSLILPLCFLLPAERRKSDPPSRAPMSADSFDERLRDVFSFRAAIPLLDEYLSSIQIDDDDPAFLFDWQEDNVNAFVAAANGLNAAQAPPWLRTRPPLITASSFIDDVVYRLQPPLAGGRFGHIMLAPNNQQQYGAIVGTLIALQNDAFLQNAMQLALPVVNNVERYLAVTAHLTDSRVHNARVNTLPPSLQNGHPLRRLFIWCTVICAPTDPTALVI